MINVTVKTLDSQNHQFSVEDDITVEQFKRHIEVTVNVSADRQRIIYCGRVLQDNSKLKDYDVDGKVVHLVQRAPPSAATRNGRSITPPPDLNRARGGFRGFDRVGNTVYMPMPFPQGFMDPQQMIPPRATHTLSVSRLNVARRMLRQAEASIRVLENPSNSDQPPPEEQQQEEMTPVIEARVILPSSGDQSAVDDAIVNAVENTIFGTATSNADEAAISSGGTSNQPSDIQNNDQPSDTRSTPENSTPRSGSSENVSGENQETGANSNSSRRTRGPEMAELLTTLNQLQVRFAPFLARYQAFMHEDPQVSAEDLESTRRLMNRVSQVLHFLGHAYHSLSDIMINVDQPPPRLLFCRPILIQHSAVVQAGIPIQVEAQINVSADRPGTASTTTSSSSTTSTTTTTSSTTINTTTIGSTPTTNTNGSSAAPNAGQSATASGITLQPGFVGLPFMPTGSMRVITTPLEFRTLHARPGNVTNPSRPSAPPRTESQPTAPVPPSGESGQSRTGPAPPNSSNPFAANNGNLEFFMEVTPEGITIDSLESLAGSNQTANEFLRSGNLIHSLMQLVGSHLGGGLGQAAQQQQQAQSQATPSSADAPNNGTPNSQSQARGNTQTNPTTATHTRSTPRPHVHMTQQAVQGGFDPFLPCYSHHVSHTRGQRIIPVNQPNRSEATPARDASSAQTSSTSTQTNQQAQRTNTSPPNYNNLVAQFENAIRGIPPHMPPIVPPENQQTIQMFADNLSELFNQQMAQGQHQPPPQRGAPDGQRPPRPLHQETETSTLLSNLMSQAVPQLMRNGPTLDHYFQTLYPNSYVQGESIVDDLMRLMLGNMRFNDFLLLERGNMTPLSRQVDSVRRFILNDVCQNDTSDSGIQRATDRVINDCRPIIAALESVPARDGIDMSRTINNFFRQRLFAFIQLAVSSRSAEDQSNSNRTDLVTTLWTAAKELLTLVIHCSANGQQGVEAAFEGFLSNVPPGPLDFVAPMRRLALRMLINNLDTRSTDVQQYVVQQTPESTSNEPAVEAVAVENNDLEAMEVEYATSPPNQEQMVDTSIKVEETEPLPNVIWGSEQWHRQAPEEWVPIITRDIQRQRRQNSQPPFSDAYLSGMPSKRRKLVNKSKPQGSLPQVISESVREAVTATGLTSVAPLDVVAEAAGQSVEIQTAYRTLLRQTVQANLRDNEDFTPERFPNTSKYFNGPPPE